MDDFEIKSAVGSGTTIVMRKWTKASGARIRSHHTLG
jgi:hypothetical protein